MSPQQAVDHFGSQAKLARALEIKQPSVAEWVAAGAIPVPRQFQIEVLTGGALRAERASNNEAAA